MEWSERVKQERNQVLGWEVGCWICPLGGSLLAIALNSSAIWVKFGLSFGSDDQHLSIRALQAGSHDSGTWGRKVLLTIPPTMMLKHKMVCWKNNWCEISRLYQWWLHSADPHKVLLRWQVPTLQFQMKIHPPVDQQTHVNTRAETQIWMSKPSQRRGYCCHSEARVPSMEEFLSHLLKLMSDISPLTAPNHQPIQYSSPS